MSIIIGDCACLGSRVCLLFLLFLLDYRYPYSYGDHDRKKNDDLNFERDHDVMKLFLCGTGKYKGRPEECVDDRQIMLAT